VTANGWRQTVDLNPQSSHVERSAEKSNTESFSTFQVGNPLAETATIDLCIRELDSRRIGSPG